MSVQTVAHKFVELCRQCLTVTKNDKITREQFLYEGAH
jgi:hypothetical protein